MTTIAEAANALRVSEKTVRRRIKDGSLPAQLVGEPPRYEIAPEVVADLASSLSAGKDAWSGEAATMLGELMDSLQLQLKEKDRQLEEKDRQIRELHVLLQTSQEHLSRAMLPAPPAPPSQALAAAAARLPSGPANPSPPWWRFWN
jgi:excisionase family DNA binding protein